LYQGVVDKFVLAYWVFCFYFSAQRGASNRGFFQFACIPWFSFYGTTVCCRSSLGGGGAICRRPFSLLYVLFIHSPSLAAVTCARHQKLQSFAAVCCYFLFRLLGTSGFVFEKSSMALMAVLVALTFTATACLFKRDRRRYTINEIHTALEARFLSVRELYCALLLFCGTACVPMLQLFCAGARL
jgi:hypothetical protein